jgi:hypothetical protein
MVVRIDGKDNASADQNAVAAKRRNARQGGVVVTGVDVALVKRTVVAVPGHAERLQEISYG